MTARPLISVILPVRNGGADVGRAIAAIRASTFRDYELIVVDDASTDDTGATLSAVRPDVHLSLPENAGPYACRNLAVRHARGELLFFTDADVTLAPDTLERVARHWTEHQRACVIGVYTHEHPNTDVWSTYKNAWIRFSYLSAPVHVDWFFTAVGMIRKDVWEEHRGFDGRLANDEMGDLEFGRVLSRRGVTIYKDDALGVTHWKAFDARSLLRNQRLRAAASFRAAFRLQVISDVPKSGYANASRAFIVATVLAPTLPILAALAPVWPWVGIAWLAAATAWFSTVAPFAAYARRQYGTTRAVAFTAISWLDHVACALGLLDGTRQLLRPKPRPERTVAYRVVSEHPATSPGEAPARAVAR